MNKIDGKNAAALEVVQHMRNRGKTTILVDTQTRTFGALPGKPSTVLDAPKTIARSLADFDPWADATPVPYRAEIGGVQLQDFVGLGQSKLVFGADELPDPDDGPNFP
jgi:hypothetical protein